MIAARTMAMMNMILKPGLILRLCLLAFTASMMKSIIDTKMYAIIVNPNAENIGPNLSRDKMIILL